ncbi:MAG: hypothetical protein A2V90_06465 [Gammaproteobacteria bacterium RBG_16_57_12]|nr:MAG: hypothetical protein A2V90_06465 [Gammaproteobacteria bacterium RBG_16_57_12]
MKVISGVAQGDCTPWSPPDMSGPGTIDVATAVQYNRYLTPGKLEEIQQQAYKEAYATGFKRGKTEGYAAAVDEIRSKLGQLQQIMSTLEQPLQELDDHIEEQLVTLAITIARHLIRRELKTDPGQIVAVVREAVNALPLASRHVRIYLHPDDAVLIREALSLAATEGTWRIEEDPMVTRGGCKVLSENSHIDATVETRLSAVIAKMLGGERGQDSEQS